MSIVKAGGAKGEAIVKAMSEHPDWSRKQIADHVKCTVGRVGECVRWLHVYGDVEEQKVVAPFLARAKKPEPAPEPAPVKKPRARRTKATV